MGTTSMESLPPDAPQKNNTTTFVPVTGVPENVTNLADYVSISRDTIYRRYVKGTLGQIQAETFTLQNLSPDYELKVTIDSPAAIEFDKNPVILPPTSRTQVTATFKSSELEKLPEGRSLARLKFNVTTDTVITTPPKPPVTPAKTLTLSINPSTATLTMGTTLQLTPELRDETGALVDLGLVTWSTSNRDIAIVSSNGIVTAVPSLEVTPQTATIILKSETRTATATIVVVPEPPVPPVPPTNPRNGREEDEDQTIPTTPSTPTPTGTGGGSDDTNTSPRRPLDPDKVETMGGPIATE